MQIKKIICLTLVFFFLLNLPEAFSQTLLKGKISAVVEKGKIINVSISTPINFYFSAEGDSVAAFIKHDIRVSDDLYIPKGSRIEGKISKIVQPKNLGRDGSFELEFSEIITPKNLSVPIYAKVSTDKEETSGKIAKILTYDTALVSYGAANGAIAAIQYGGIPLAISSYGISVGVGAGVGASAGIIGSVRRKGKIPIVTTDVHLPVSLKSNLYVFGDLPSIKEKEEAKINLEEEYIGFRFSPAIKKENVEVSLIDLKRKRDKKYGSYILLKVNVKNNSDRKLNISDLALVSNETDEKPIHPDVLLTGLEMLKTVDSYNSDTVNLAFLVSKKLEEYKIALFDPMDQKEIVTVPLSVEKK